jgi:hypothetical protein
MKILPTVTVGELVRGMAIAREAKKIPLPKHMTLKGPGLTVADSPEARQMVGLIKEFGERAYAISMRLSILARNADQLGGHYRKSDSMISEAALWAIAEIPILNETDPGPELILDFIAAKGGHDHG